METSTYPNGTNFWKTPDYKGAGQRNLNICLIAFSTLFISLRVYVRVFMTKTPGWDDAVAVFAWASLPRFFGSVERQLTNHRHVVLCNQVSILSVSMQFLSSDPLSRGGRN
jgi:hypothetical protein